MILKLKTSSIFNCSLERAFKTPMLCDITKVHTGFLFSPKVTHTTNHENWGKVGFSKKVFAVPSLLNKKAYIFDDKVLERIENKYWKIEVSNFQNYMFGFTKFIGIWETTEIEANKIQVDYSYELHADNFIFYPLNWLFAKLFWKVYMKRVLGNIKVMTENTEPYLFD